MRFQLSELPSVVWGHKPISNVSLARRRRAVTLRPRLTVAQPRILTTDYTFVSPSPIARRLLWHVLGVGLTRHDAPVRQEPFAKPGAVLLWVESGAGALEIGPDRFTLERGPVFFLFNLVKPQFFSPVRNTGLVIRTIRFSGPGLELWLAGLGIPGNPRFQLNKKTAAQVRSAQARLWRWVKG